MKTWVLAAWTVLKPAWHVLLAAVAVIAAVIWMGLRLTPHVTPGQVTVTPPATEHAATVTTYTNPTDAQRKLVELQVQNAQLLDEVKKLHSSIASITTAVATLSVQSGGAFVPVPGPPGPPGVPGAPATPAAASTRYRYQDWRLLFEGDTAIQKASYTLSQHFEVDHVMGRDAKGQATSLLRMFEIGPGATKTPVPTVTTTTVIDEAPVRWWRSPTIQAGIGWDWALAASTFMPTGTSSTSGLVALRWLAKGKSAAAEDSSLAVLTPMLVLSNSAQAIGVSPASVNLGRLKYQPFRDIWLTPYLAFDVGGKSAGKTRLGISFLASF